MELENKLYHILNELTCINNQIIKNEMFAAGGNLVVLQNFIVRWIEQLPKKEGSDGTTES